MTECAWQWGRVDGPMGLGLDRSGRRSSPHPCWEVPMAARGARLPRWRPAPRRPPFKAADVDVRRPTVALLALAGSIRLVGFAALHAVGAEPPIRRCCRRSPPVPWPSRLPASQKRLRAGPLVVEFEEQRAGPTPAAGGVLEGTVKFPGRFQHASDGHLWRVDHGLYPSRLS